MNSRSVLSNNHSSLLRKTRLASSIAIALGSLLTFSVVAEENAASENINKDSTVTENKATGNSAKETSVGETSKYENIIVTGQKTSRTLQETPASIAVFTTEKMEEQNIGDISEVLFDTANVHSTASGGFNIRGIDGFNVSGAGSSDLATVYIDGAALPTRMASNGFSTWDVSQIEVLRGPQSTIQGRNSLAGAIILTTQAPTHEFGGKYRVQIGENGEQEFAVAVGGSLVKDELAFRFSAESEEFDGYNYNITRDEDSGYRSDKLYRLKFLYTPQALPDLSAQLSFTHAETDRGLTEVDTAVTGDQFQQRTVINDAKQERNYENDIANLEVNYAINDIWQLTSLSTYAKSRSGWEDFDNDNTADPEGVRFLDEQAKTFSQELRLTFNSDNLTGVIGAYYFDQKKPSDFGGVTSISLASAGVNAEFLQAQYGLDEGTATFVVDQYAAFDPVQLNQASTANPEISTVALFADVTYSINEQWDIFAGIRWDKEEQSISDSQFIEIGNLEDMPVVTNYPAALQPLIGGINALVLAQAEDANGDIPAAESSFDEVIPKLGVSYHWNDDMTTSLTVQQGYRSGGSGINLAKATVYSYEPEFTTNYELSMRSFWLDGELMVNANVFYTDWEDQQVNVQLSANSFDSEVQNAGKSKVQGFELETYYQITDNLELSMALGLSDSEFTEFNVEIPIDGGEDIVRDLSGRSFADAPEWTSNIAATYRADNGIFANISVNYADSSQAEVDPDVNGLDSSDVNYDPENEARTLVNMKVGYEWDNLGLYLIGKNLLDEEYISGASFGSGRRVERIRLGDPRQMSLSLRGSF